MAAVNPETLGLKQNQFSSRDQQVANFGALMGMSAKVIEGQFMEVAGVDEDRAKDAFGEIRGIQESCACCKQAAGMFACCCCICTLGLSCIPAWCCGQYNNIQMKGWAEKYPLIAEHCYRNPEVLLMTGMKCPKPSDKAVEKRKAAIAQKPAQEEMK